MTDHNDQDLMAALFVSEEGLVEPHPEWWSLEEGWPDGWCPLSLIPGGAAAGILRLIRERDEARDLAERYGDLLVPRTKP